MKLFTWKRKNIKRKLKWLYLKINSFFLRNSIFSRKKLTMQMILNRDDIGKNLNINFEYIIFIDYYFYI